jgi:outer membrane protein assembly factor BamB
MFFRFLDEDRNGTIVEKEWEKIFGWLGAFEHANAIFAIRPATGEKPAEVVWQHNQGVPECPSPLYYRGLLYLVKNGGMVSCFDAATGEVHYRERLDSRGPHYASPVAGDGKIYSASARGQVTVFEAGETLKVLARNQLGERIMATPALVDGKVYVRTETNLYAFGAAD